MAKTVYVKKVTSGIPTGVSSIGVRQLNDVNDSGIGATNKYLVYNDSASEFRFAPIDGITTTLRALTDVDDADLSPTNRFLQYDSVSTNFVFKSLEDITVGVSSINGLTGDVILSLLDSSDIGSLTLDSSQVLTIVQANQVQVDSIDGGTF
tara:strand:- start:16870 stop:17322 length:453 start_codon:yes stop_codon:yes gene_type:complete